MFFKRDFKIIKTSVSERGAGFFEWDDSDPNFFLGKKIPSLPILRGYYVVEITCNSASDRLSKFYVDYGSGFCEEYSFPQEVIPGGISQRIFYFPRRVLKIRWDPSDKPGEISKPIIRFFSITRKSASHIMRKQVANCSRDLTLTKETAELPDLWTVYNALYLKYLSELSSGIATKRFDFSLSDTHHNYFANRIGKVLISGFSSLATSKPMSIFRNKNIPSGPEVHAYLLCYNEEAIIGSVLDYYQSICSRIFILDNMSTDNSLQIAKQYSNVTVIPWSSDGEFNDALGIKIKLKYYKDFSRRGGRYTKKAADWVIVSDMDEILYHPNLLEVLSDYKSKGITVPQITGFEVVGENELIRSKPITEQYTHGFRNVGMDKRIIFDPEFDMVYSLGAHPQGPGFELMKRSYGYSTSNEHQLAMLHFKYIGNRWFETAKKNAPRIAGEIKQRPDGKHAGTGHHYTSILKGSITFEDKRSLAAELFDEYSNIRFNEFLPTTGEIGSTGIDSNASLSPDDFNLLRDVAFAYEKIDKDTSYRMLKILIRFKPEASFVKKKIQEYERLK